MSIQPDSTPVPALPQNLLDGPDYYVNGWSVDPNAYFIQMIGTNPVSVEMNKRMKGVYKDASKLANPTVASESRAGIEAIYNEKCMELKARVIAQHPEFFKDKDLTKVRANIISHKQRGILNEIRDGVKRTFAN